MAELKRKQQSGNLVLDGISAVSDITNLLVDKKITKSGSTDVTGPSTKTVQTQVSPEDALAITNDVLAQNSGLASLLSGSNAAGIYNDTSRQQLASQLLGTITAKVAADSAPTVTQDSGQTVQHSGDTTITAAPLDPTGTLLSVGGLLAGNKLLEKTGILGGSAASSSGGILDSISGLFSGGNAGASTTGAALDIGSGLASNAFDIGTTAAAGSSAGSFAGAGLDLTAGAGVGAGSGAGAFAGSAGLDLATASAGTAAGASTGFLDSIGLGSNASFGSVAPYVPAVLQLVNGKPAEAAGTAALTAAGAAVGGPVGAAIGSVIGSVLSGGCYITTAAIEALGEADDGHTLSAMRDFRDQWGKIHHPDLVQQYYVQAPKLVAQIDKLNEDSRRYFYGTIAQRYLLPTVAYWEAGQPEKALQTYSAMVNDVEKLAEELGNVS